MTAGRRPGKPTGMNIMNYLNMLSSGSSADRIGDVAYMAENPGREVFLQFCNDVMELYEETYLTG